MSGARICILDYGMGNLRSVEKALEHVGATATISSDSETLRGADGLILPGVGAFPKAMERVRELGLDELIRERRDAGVPILGICLGLQLLFDSTTELGGAAGIGLLPGGVSRARRAGAEGPAHRLVAGPLGEALAPDRGDRERDSVLLRPLLRAAAAGRRSARQRRLRHPLRLRRGARERLRRPVPPGEVERRRAAPARQLRRGLRQGADAGVILYPAIDIRGGQAVRLLEGDYERETTYDADPVDAAKRWADEGAEHLHVVDLDGAKAGEPRNLAAIERIAAAVPCPIQVGGGLRTAEAVQQVLDTGAERVVIGTAALKDPEFLQAMLDAHGDRVVVSVDARAGRVALEGWTAAGEETAVDAVATLGEKGVARFLCTAIEVDGTMEGPAIDQLQRPRKRNELQAHRLRRGWHPPRPPPTRRSGTSSQQP